MQRGFRSFANGYRVIVFITNKPKEPDKPSDVELPSYVQIKDEHDLGRDNALEFEVLVPHDQGVDFWKWCQEQEEVAIKLDMQQEFHCPSCLRKTEQGAWTPRKSPAKNLFQVIARCNHCGSFYLVIWATTKGAAKKIPGGATKKIQRR